VTVTVLPLGALTVGDLLGLARDPLTNGIDLQTDVGRQHHVGGLLIG
jgi:hypothetical protein